MVTKLLIVTGAGGVGAAARYLLGAWVQAAAGSRFPFGTLTVNVIGCLLIGVVMHLFEQRQALSENARLALVVGLLGSFTTFSAFGYETFELLRARDIAPALLNIAASVALCLGAVWAGWSLARLLPA